MIIVDMMSMPKNCCECLFWRYCPKLKIALSYRLGRWEHNMIERSIFCNRRCEDCPLTEIPDSATNGDVIKILFPDAICIQEDTFVYIYKNKKKFELKVYLTKVSKKWWNAPYEAESEDKG